eukprot:c9243_g1_i3.p1 GENE.c9243_g1_i3~~c9243_g1_i3.p1  ORF type:complete len:259 (+),score=64.61 c9243_g1_i3:305-1081(+)
MDDTVVAEHDFGANFLFTEGDIGKNRAQAARARVQELNPMVNVEVQDISISTFLVSTNPSPFSIVIASNIHPQHEVLLDDWCRVRGIAFLTAQSFGFHATLLMDLGAFVYKPDKTDKTDEPAPVQVQFGAVRDVYLAPWSTIPKVRRLSKLWLAASAYAHVVLDQGNKPQASDLLSAVQTKATMLAVQAQLPESFLSNDDVSVVCDLRANEVGAVCAVLGGIIGQEVVKIVSGVGAPIHNIFCFNAISAQGVVELVGC